jgi:hypothetical protein
MPKNVRAGKINRRKFLAATGAAAGIATVARPVVPKSGRKRGAFSDIASHRNYPVTSFRTAGTCSGRTLTLHNNFNSTFINCQVRNVEFTSKRSCVQTFSWK